MLEKNFIESEPRSHRECHHVEVQLGPRMVGVGKETEKAAATTRANSYSKDADTV